VAMATPLTSLFLKRIVGILGNILEVWK